MIILNRSDHVFLVHTIRAAQITAVVTELDTTDVLSLIWNVLLESTVQKSLEHLQCDLF